MGRTGRTAYEVRCLMCGAEVGRIVDGVFQQHAGCEAPMPQRSGQLRCCHCGGSLYREPISGYPEPPPGDRLQQRRAEPSLPDSPEGLQSGSSRQEMLP